MAEAIQLDIGGNTTRLDRDIQKTVNKAYTINLKTKGSQPLGRITGQVNEFTKSLDASNARVIAFGASAGVIFGLKKAFDTLVSSTIEVQKSLTDINVILNVSSSQLASFGGELFKIAKNTGQSFNEVAQAATEFSRQGLGVEETLKRTSQALILSRLSGLDAAKSVDALTAAVNSFASQAVTATDIVNKFANVDAAFAVSSADLAEAISRVGSSAAQSGVQLDELIALVTSAQQTTARGGAVIGNSFKTIFTRLQRGKVIDLLGSLGISDTDASGSVKSTIQLLQDLAGVYDTLGSRQKAAIAEQVGGVFQINILKATLADLGKEYSTYSSALNISASSTDEAIKRNEALNKTYSAQINALQENAKQLAASAGSRLLGPAFDRVVGNANSILGSVNESDGQSYGAVLGKGILDGLGQFIAGPGLALIGGVLLKLFKDFGKFASGSVRELLGLNAAANQQRDIQESISQILAKNPKLIDLAMKGEAGLVSASARLLSNLELQTAQLAMQDKLSAKIANKFYNSGGRMSGGVPVAPIGKGKARGFIPNYVQGGAVEKAEAMALGATPSVRAHMSQGTIGGRKFVMNNQETEYTGVGSNGDSMVIPHYAARGFIPNFAQNSKRGYSVWDGDSLKVDEDYPDKRLQGKELRLESVDAIESWQKYGEKGSPNAKSLAKSIINKEFTNLDSVLKSNSKTGKAAYDRPYFKSDKLQEGLIRQGLGVPDLRYGSSFNSLAMGVMNKPRPIGLWSDKNKDGFYNHPKAQQFIKQNNLEKKLSSQNVPQYKKNFILGNASNWGNGRYKGELLPDIIKSKGKPGSKNYRPERAYNYQTMTASGFIPNFANTGTGSVIDLGDIAAGSAILKGKVASLIHPRESTGIQKVPVQSAYRGQKFKGLLPTAGINKSALKQGINIPNVEDDVEQMLLNQANNFGQVLGSSGLPMIPLGKGELPNTGAVKGAAGVAFEGGVKSVVQKSLQATTQNANIDFAKPSSKLKNIFNNAPGVYDAKYTPELADDVLTKLLRFAQPAVSGVTKQVTSGPGFKDYQTKRQAALDEIKKSGVSGSIQVRKALREKGFARGFIPNFAELLNYYHVGNLSGGVKSGGIHVSKSIEDAILVGSSLAGTDEKSNLYKLLLNKPLSSKKGIKAIDDGENKLSAVMKQGKKQKVKNPTHAEYTNLIEGVHLDASGKAGFLRSTMLLNKNLVKSVKNMGPFRNFKKQQVGDKKLFNASRLTQDHFKGYSPKELEKLKSEGVDLQNYRTSNNFASGFIPNFSSTNRGVPISQIRAHFDKSGSPVAVTNTRDEPNGLKDAIGRERKGIGMYAGGFIPNYADNTAGIGAGVAAITTELIGLGYVLKGSSNTYKESLNQMENGIKGSANKMQKFAAAADAYGSAISIGAPIIASTINSMISQSSKEGRGASALVTGAGNALSMASTGGQLGGAFGPQGAVIGTVLGGVAGALMSMPDVINGFTSSMPELTRASEEASQSLTKFNDISQRLGTASETLSNALSEAVPSGAKIKKAQDDYAAVLSEFSVAEQNRVTGATDQKSEIEKIRGEKERAAKNTERNVAAGQLYDKSSSIGGVGQRLLSTASKDPIEKAAAEGNRKIEKQAFIGNLLQGKTGEDAGNVFSKLKEQGTSDKFRELGYGTRTKGGAKNRLPELEKLLNESLPDFEGKGAYIQQQLNLAGTSAINFGGVVYSIAEGLDEEGKKVAEANKNSEEYRQNLEKEDKAKKAAIKAAENTISIIESNMRIALEAADAERALGQSRRQFSRDTALADKFTRPAQTVNALVGEEAPLAQKFQSKADVAGIDKTFQDGVDKITYGLTGELNTLISSSATAATQKTMTEASGQEGAKATDITKAAAEAEAGGAQQVKAFQDIQGILNQNIQGNSGQLNFDTLKTELSAKFDELGLDTNQQTAILLKLNEGSSSTNIELQKLKEESIQQLSTLAKETTQKILIAKITQAQKFAGGIEEYINPPKPGESTFDKAIKATQGMDQFQGQKNNFAFEYKKGTNDFRYQGTAAKEDRKKKAPEYGRESLKLIGGLQDYFGYTPDAEGKGSKAAVEGLKVTLDEQVKQFQDIASNQNTPDIVKDEINNALKEVKGLGGTENIAKIQVAKKTGSLSEEGFQKITGKFNDPVLEELKRTNPELAMMKAAEMIISDDPTVKAVNKTNSILVDIKNALTGGTENGVTTLDAKGNPVGLTGGAPTDLSKQVTGALAAAVPTPQPQVQKSISQIEAETVKARDQKQFEQWSQAGGVGLGPQDDNISAEWKKASQLDQIDPMMRNIPFGPMNTPTLAPNYTENATGAGERLIESKVNMRQWAEHPDEIQKYPGRFGDAVSRNPFSSITYDNAMEKAGQPTRTKQTPAKIYNNETGGPKAPTVTSPQQVANDREKTTSATQSNTTSNEGLTTAVQSLQGVIQTFSDSINASNTSPKTASNSGNPASPTQGGNQSSNIGPFNVVVNQTQGDITSQINEALEKLKGEILKLTQIKVPPTVPSSQVAPA